MKPHSSVDDVYMMTDYRHTKDDAQKLSVSYIK
jgi:hypothetical protein